MKVCCVCQLFYDDSVTECDEIGHDLRQTFPGGPDIIDGYRLESLVSSDGAADIFLARQTDSGARCLIEVLNSNSEPFLRDAKLAARLFDPHIIDIYETGQLDREHAYVVMEDAAGRSLREYLSDVGVPDLLTTVELVRQAADALHELHIAGLTHGAVNPDNIVLTMGSEGRPMVRLRNLDLGGVIARSITGNKFLIDSYVDRLKYFAPEQFSGDEIGPTTDIYSLGIVFYEMLAGRPPFNALKAVGLIEKHRHERPPDIRIDNFELRMLVTHSLSESLQKFPGSRQPSANFFARQLRHVEQLATRSSTPPPAISAPDARPEPRPLPVRPTVHEPVFVPRPEPPPVIAEIAEPVYEIVGTNLSAQKNEMQVVPDERSTTQLDEVPPVQKPEKPIAAVERKATAVPTIARRSKLRSLKKKLHTLAARVAAETQSRPVVLNINAAEPLHASLEKEPLKIEWEQPADDIPSVADVREELAKDAISTRPIGPASEKTTIVLSPTPKKPDVVKESTPVLPEIDLHVPARPAEPKQEKVPRPAITMAPRVVPPAEPAQRASAKEPIAPPVTVVRPRSAGSPKQTPAVAPPAVRVAATASTGHRKTASGSETKPAGSTAVVDQEEITVVRPRSRPIRIDLEKVQPRRTYQRAETSLSLSGEIDFFPTILGQIDKVPDAGSPSEDGMFAIYSPSKTGPASIPARFIAASVGFLALAVLILFGSTSITKYFETSGESASITSTSSPESLPAAVTAEPAKLTVRVPEKNKPKAPEPPSAVEKPLRTQPAESTSRKGKELLTWTTAARPAEKAKSEPRVKTEKNVTAKPPPTAPKAAGTTRPRIVKLPGQ